jgi:hypothetical protein
MYQFFLTHPVYEHIVYWVQWRSRISIIQVIARRYYSLTFEDKTLKKAEKHPKLVINNSYYNCASEYLIKPNIFFACICEILLVKTLFKA